MTKATFANRPSQRKMLGIVTGAIALAVGCGVLYLLKDMGLVTKLGDGAFIALVALPLVAYALAVYSDSITEFTAGGFAFKFEQFANSEVSVGNTSSDAQADIDTVELVQKSSHEALRERRRTLSREDKVAMTIRLGLKNFYTTRGIHAYLNGLLAQDADMPVIFVDDDGRFVASTMGVKLRDALVTQNDADDASGFIGAIEQSGKDNILRLEEFVALTSENAGPKTTNLDALKTMLAEDISVLVSVNKAEKPVGVIRRDAIMAKMLTNLVS